MLVGFLRYPDRSHHTRVKGGIDNLLCAPQVRSHRLDLALLVGGDQILCIFKTSWGGKQCSVDEIDQSIVLEW